MATNLRRFASFAVIALAVFTAGCSSLSERFDVPGRDPLLTMLGADYDTRARDWPAVEMPYLRPMRTELIPDRLPPPGVPPLGWPPL